MTEKVPNDDVGIYDIRGIAQGRTCRSTWPGMSTITHDVMFYYDTFGAVFPGEARDIALVKDYLR